MLPVSRDWIDFVCVCLPRIGIECQREDSREADSTLGEKREI